MSSTAGEAVAAVSSTFRHYRVAATQPVDDLHPYGAHNFVKDQAEFKKNVESIRVVLRRYHEWCKGGQPANRLLLALKDKSQAESTMTQVKVAAGTCMGLLEVAAGRVSHVLDDTLQRLEELAKDLKLQFQTDTDTMPGVVSVFIQEEMFYVEIEIEKRADKTGFVKEVKVEHTHANTVDAPPLVDTQLTDALRRADFALFGRSVRGLCAFYALAAEEATRTALYSVFASLNADLATISRGLTPPSSRCTGVRQLVQGPHGALMAGTGVAPSKVIYHVTPRQGVKIDAALKEDALLHPEWSDAAMEAQEVRYLLEAGETATITLEQGPSGLLSTRPLVVETKDNMPETAMPLYVESLTMQRPDEGGPYLMPLDAAQSVELGASYILQLTRPLLALASLLPRLRLATGKSCSGPVFDQGDASAPFTLEHSLLAQARGSSHALSKPVTVVQVGDEVQHQYNLMMSKGQRAVSVHRIPFTDLQQLQPLLQLLRQQHAYNQLFLSCLGHTMDNTGASTSVTHVFEVSVEAPRQIHVVCRHPSRMSVFSVTVTIRLGGRVTAALYMTEEDERPCSDDDLTQYVSQTLSIPLALHLMYATFDRQVQVLVTKRGREPDDSPEDIPKRSRTSA